MPIPESTDIFSVLPLPVCHQFLLVENIVLSILLERDEICYISPCK